MRIAIIGGGISGLTTIGYFVSPGRTLMKISATILALSLLGGCTASLPPVGTVERVDLQRFMGDWYVIAATLNVSMAWLRGRYLLAAIFGAIGGPLAYYGGAELGATEALPSLNGILILALGWGVMTPLLVWLARVCAFVEGWKR
jgi:hypothetical protein